MEPSSLTIDAVQIIRTWTTSDGLFSLRRQLLRWVGLVATLGSGCAMALTGKCSLYNLLPMLLVLSHLLILFLMMLSHLFLLMLSHLFPFIISHLFLFILSHLFLCTL